MLELLPMLFHLSMVLKISRSKSQDSMYLYPYLYEMSMHLHFEEFLMPWH